MTEEKILVILKPDCAQRDLTEEVVSHIKESGLSIIDKKTRNLKRKEVLFLYEEYAETETFPQLVRYMLSGPSTILLLSGKNAVHVFNQIKGRTGSGKGIRGKYAENFIRNIVHSAETPYKTSIEIKTFFPTEDISMNKKKVMIGLSGMTESGKSTAGIHFDSRGVKRFKIVKILDLVRKDHQPEIDVNSFVDTTLKKNPEWLRQAFADKLLDEMGSLGINHCSMESMGDPEMVKYLRGRFPDEFVSVYIDATLDNRLRYQMIREDLSDVEDAKKILLPKDEFKRDFWRMPEIIDIADYVVDNNGGLEELKDQLDNILSEEDVL